MIESKGYRIGFFIVAMTLIAMIVTACTKPRGVLSTDKMAHVLADIHIAESVTEQERNAFKSDSMKQVLKQSILMRNGVTSEQFDSSLSWYGYNLEKYIEVYDKVIEILEKDMEKVQASAGSATEVTASQRFLVEGDSVDVWPDIRYRRFSSNLPTDMITFSLTSDQNWEKGDVYKLSARMAGSMASTELTLVTEYREGGEEYQSSVSNNDGWHHVTLALDPERTASNVYGILRYDAPQGNTALMDSISLYRIRKSPRAEELRRQQKKLSGKYGR
ncbi:MAG: DUF4296 domain-containing protein [Paramuribaculum sp.]|nr:DUF4296 domain-containing protein [Paramuribaculum sp.]